ncbi:hypothetical protein [Pseudomonas corrugata]|uniref:hypothetical protein n=1 Tax=Pseudomonas corrugata TaxID=47879 RepID=UPI001586DA9B|nr:hypothetical protein [Pseudomonas corrugata]MCI0997783.1 hypothetical protein [Pseudomonas corrugata]NUT69433.1 hypothetical protein [Pseudomonas corrugata]
MIYSTLSDTPIRTRLMRWTASLFLTLTCCTLISHQESLSTLAQRLDGTNDETQLQHLESKIQELEQFILTAQQADDTATRSAINNMRDEVNEHFEGIELALTAHVSRQDLKPLLQRIELIEASHQRPMQSLPSPKSTYRKPKKKTPEFQVLGRELRGGHPFLAVGLAGIQSLDQSHLLRVGDSFQGWKLEGFDEQTAVFVADGITHHLSIR